MKIPIFCWHFCAGVVVMANITAQPSHVSYAKTTKDSSNLQNYLLGKYNSKHHTVPSLKSLTQP